MPKKELLQDIVKKSVLIETKHPNWKLTSKTLKKGKLRKCLVCSTLTTHGVNINLTLKPLCNDCATAIMLQQSTFLALEYNKNNKNE